jgi:hypothetical protein
VNPFLRGFTDELVKVADTSFTTATPRPQLVRPPSTATGTEGVPKPPNMNAPSGDMLSAIPKQRMESPAGAAPNTWRPSPGYKPNPVADPVTDQPKPVKPTIAAPKPATNAPAWESFQQKNTREVAEGK